MIRRATHLANLGSERITGKPEVISGFFRSVSCPISPLMDFVLLRDGSRRS